ncbi:MAG: gliding motility-associated C-terminal domain-containing protein [Flavobacteriales bacterium]|nr:gliding motility-associated C-terminal domain-containing protein [Flavobacteriales bacterium]
MSLGGGQGDCESINNLLASGSYSEGLEIVRIPCQDQYWLLAYECMNNFVRFTVDDNGIGQATDLLSYDPGDWMWGYDGRGELDYHAGHIAMSYAWSYVSYLADFDPLTGDMTNGVEIGFPSNGGMYGAEFSPDGSKLFLTTWYGGTWSGVDTYQYDISTGQIINEWLAIDGDAPAGGTGQIELGPDGNLYIVHDFGNNITKITNANSTSPTLENIVTISQLALGVSDHIQSDVFGSIGLDVENPCLGIPAEFSAPSLSYEGTTYEWNFGDPDSGAGNTSTEENPVHEFTEEGPYTITLIVNNDFCQDTLEVEIYVAEYPVVDIGPDIEICSGESTIIEAGTDPDYSLHWSTGSGDPSIEVEDEGIYWVNVYNYDCVASDTLLVDEITPPDPDLGPDIEGCDGQSELLDPDANADSYLWSTGATTPTLSITESGTYTVELTLGPCVVEDEIDVVMYPIPAFDLGPDIRLCEAGTVPLTALHYDGATYEWSTGEDTEVIYVDETGEYTAEITLGPCTYTDQIFFETNAYTPYFFLPNIFTPNGDSKNEKFGPDALDLATYSMKLYNRWGALVFESDNFTDGWDGKIGSSIASEGTYYYIIEFTYYCNEEVQRREGSFYLAEGK